MTWAWLGSPGARSCWLGPREMRAGWARASRTSVSKAGVARAGRRVPRYSMPLLARSKLADSWARPMWVDGVVGWPKGAQSTSNFEGKRWFGGEKEKGGKGRREKREKEKKGKEKKKIEEREREKN